MFEGVHVRTTRVDLEVCCAITNEAYVCFRRAKDKLKGMPAVIVCVFVCASLSASRKAHGGQHQAQNDLLHHKSEITPLKSTQHFKHTPTHAQTHVQSQTPSCPLCEL